MFLLSSARMIISRVDATNSGAPIDGRSDDGIVKLILGEFDFRIRCRNIGGILADERCFGVGLFLGGEVLRQQLLVAPEVHFCVFELGGRPLFSRLPLQDASLVRRRIDRHQRVADFDVVAFGEIQLA